MTIGSEKPLKNIKWCPPKKRIVKINTYATLDLTNKAIDLGVIDRDDKGMFCERHMSGGIYPYQLMLHKLKLFYSGLD